MKTLVSPRFNDALKSAPVEIRQKALSIIMLLESSDLKYLLQQGLLNKLRLERKLDTYSIRVNLKYRIIAVMDGNQMVLLDLANLADQ